MPIQTRNIFVDTCIFESENFVEGKKLLQLIKLGAEEELNIIITRIAYNEIIARGRKKIAEGKTILKKLSKDGRVLRNLEEFKPLFRKIDIEEELQKLKVDIDELLVEGKITILEYTEIEIKNIFDSYFNNQPPFKEGNKKHEFPDAFSLEIVRKWCSENDEYCYCLSNDNDMDLPEGDRLIRIDNFPKFIDDRIREYEKKKRHEERLNRIDKLFEDNYANLKTSIRDELEYNITDDLKFGHYNVDEVQDIDIGDIEILTHSIVYVGDIDAKIELTIEFKLEANLLIEDYDSAWYDKEDNVWRFVDYRDESISETIRIPVFIIVNHNPLAGIEYADVKLDTINEGRDIRI